MATADNLKIAQQLLATMQQITAQVEKQTEAYHAQAQLVDALCKAQDCFGKIDAVKVKEVTEALREAQEKTKEFGKEIEEVADGEATKLEGALRRVSQVVKDVSIPAEFLNGLRSGLTISTSLFKNILSMGGSAFGLLKDIGGIFISLPGRLLDFFQGAAGGGTDEYKSALEELRKEFGNLEVGTSAAVKNMTESMHGLGESGLRMSQVFGYGRAGLAKLLRENMEIAKGMGPIFSEFAASLRGSERDFTVLRKATGLNAEALKTFYITAREGGVDTGTAIKQLTKDIARAERTFGITAKEYGADLNYMMKETGTFGIMAPKQMLTVATYARKLGLSMEALKKVMDKSLNFEDAAQQAAKLSEGFNMNIDAMKLMKAQNPTEKLEMMRKAFFKTGRNIEQMTIQERKYLAETAGVSEEEARLAFSQKNRALSGAALDAQMKKSQKQQISQQEAMQQLAKSIERLVQSGSAMKGSFFDIFAKGFESGVRRSKEFREVTRNLQRSLRAVYLAGREVGRMFVHEFPGFKNMLKGLAETFDPRRFRELMSSIIGEFRKFFKALQTDPKAGVQEFMKNMKKIFFDFFTKGTPSGMKFLDGLKTFYKTIGMIFVEGLRYALSALKDLLATVIGFVRDPSSLKKLGSEAGDGIKGMFVQAFSYVVKELWPLLQVIGGQIVELMKLLFEKYIKPHLLKLVALIFGPALFMGIARAAGAALLKVGFEKVITGFLDKMPGVAKAAGGAAGAGDAASQAQQTGTFASDMGSFAKNITKLVFAMAAIAVAIRLLMPIILSIAKEIENSGLSRESIAFTAVLIGIFGVLFIGLGNMVKAIATADIKEGGVMNAVKSIGLASVVMLALIPIAYLAVNVLGKLPAEDIAKTVFIMGAFTIMFAGIALLVMSMATVSPGMTVSFGPAMTGLGIAALVMLGVGIAAYAATKALGTLKMEEMLTAAATIGVFALLFAGIGLLTLELAAVGAVMAVGASLALVGFLAIATVMDELKDIAPRIINTFAGIKKEDAEKTFDIMDSMIDLFAKVGVLTTLIAGLAAALIVASPLAVLGILAARAFIYELAKMAKTLIQDMTSINIDETKAKALGAILGAVGDLIKNIAGAVAELMGASGRSVFGLITGIDISAATGADEKISKLLGTVKDIVSTLITSISNIQGDPTILKAKTEVFETVAKGISNMLPPLARLIEAISSSGSNSLIGILFGADAGALIGNLDKIKNFVEDFLNGIFKGPDGIVPKIADSFKNLNPSQVEGVKAGATLLSSFVPAIAQLTGSLPETIRAVTGLVDELDTEGQIGCVLDSIKNLVTGIVGSMSSTLTSVISSISTLLNNSAITPEKLKAAESIGNILKGVAELAKVFVLTPDQLRLFRVSTTWTGAQENLDTSGLSAYMSNITTQVEKLINGDGSPNNKGIKGIIEVIANMTVDENKIKGIQAVTSILEVLGRIIPSVMESMRSASDSVRAASLTPEQIQARQNLISTTLTSISTFISDMMTTIIPNVITSLQGLNIDTKALTSKVNAIKGVFELINTITAITNSLKVTTTGTGGATTTSIQSVLDTINPPLNLLIGLFSTTNVGSGAGMVRGYGQTTLNALNALANFPMPTGIASKATTIKTVFEAIKTLIEATRALKDIAGSSTQLIPSTVLHIPLQNINTVISGLTRQTQGGWNNPLTDQSRDNPLSKLGGISQRLKGKAAKMTDIASSVGELIRAAETLANLPVIGSNAATNLDNNLVAVFGHGTDMDFDSILGILDYHFGYIDSEGGGRITTITTNIRDRILTPMRDMVSAYNEFSAEIGRLGQGVAPLQLSLDNLGSSLGAAQSMTVRNAAVNATINVNVTLDTDQITTAQRTRSSNATATSPVLQMTAFNPKWGTQG